MTVKDELSAATHAALLWDPLMASPFDDERTAETDEAHLEARRRLVEAEEESAVRTAPIQIVHVPDTDLTYVLEARGQLSAPAHGKQGLHPRRAGMLEATGLPVLLAFKDGHRWKWAWLRNLPPAVPISDDPMRKRYGWPSSEFEVSDELPVPDHVEVRATPQPRLGE